MIKYKLLVLDDSIKERKHSYETLLLPDFEIIFHDDFKDLTIVDSPEIDAIFLDMVLEFSDEKQLENIDYHKYEQNFRTVLKSIKRKKPVILVSRHFSNIASWISHAHDENVEIIEFIGWPELFDLDGNLRDKHLKSTFNSKLLYRLNDYYKRTQSRKKPDESVNILSISDLQFEDPDFDKRNKLASYGKIIDKLYENNIERIDLLMITGDITFSGSKSQFEKATKWITNLIDLIFKDIDSKHERVIIVPGNHDVNLCLSAADTYEYDFANENEEFLIKSKKVIENNFGLLPFSQFAYNITKDNHWLIPTNYYNWINDTFTNWGIRIIQLNSVSSLNYKDPKKIHLSEEAIESILKEFSPIKPKKFTITLAHNSPENFGYSTRDNEQSDQRVINLIELLKRSETGLYLHGHHHNYGEYGLPELPTSKFISNGTLNIRKNTDLSFSIIEIKRKNHIFESVIPNCIKIN